MPNWCENILEVSGETEDLEEFARFVKSPDSLFDFNQVIPYPTEYARLDRDPPPDGKDGFNRGGYRWCLDNWGTKWWIQDVHVSGHPTLLTYQFDTAWSPPTPVIAKLIEWFPNLVFELHYKEEGVGFMGTLVGVNGVSKWTRRELRSLRAAASRSCR